MLRREQIVGPMPSLRSALAAIFSFAQSHWRPLAVLAVAAAGLLVAVILADEQGRHDMRYGLPLRVSCEEDLESDLWRGGCERIAGDIARTDRPSFADLYWAFVALHHSPSPTEAAARRFAHMPSDPDFDVASALKGTRYVVTPQHFAEARNADHAKAIMDELDKRDRARLLVARGGLSLTALAAGTLANLTDATVLFCVFVIMSLMILMRCHRPFP